MIRRSAILLLEVIAVLIAGFAITATLLAWRLSTGDPIRLRFLTPYLEEALNPPDHAFDVTIDDTVLTWAGWDRALDLRARGVRAVIGGRPVASVPELAVTLRLRALILGQIAPTSIEILSPRLHVVREVDGRFRVMQALIGPEEGATGTMEDPTLPRLLSALASPPQRGSLLRYLARASILGADVTIEDRRSGVTWHAPTASVILYRGSGGIAGSISLSLEGFGTPARLTGTLAHHASRGLISVSASFSDVDALSLGLVDPHLTVLSGANLKLSGRVEALAELDGVVQSARFEVMSGSGEVHLPAWYDQALVVQSMSMRGSLDSNLNRLEVESAALQLDGPRLTLAGTATGLASDDAPGTELTIEGRLVAEEVKVADLPRYWPRDAAVNPRTWVVTNMREGFVHRAEADFAIRLPQADPERTVIDRFVTTLEGTGLSLQYLKGLPPIRGSTGRARITDREMVAEFAGGGVSGLKIEQATLRITEFEKKDQPIEIEGVVQGPLRDALELLDHPPLGYSSKVGLDPPSAAGRTRTQLSFNFLAEKDIEFEGVQMTAVSDLTDVTLNTGLFGQTISEGTFHLELDTKSMTVAGRASLSGIPADLSWIEKFEPGSDFDTRMRVVATSTADQRQALGLDLRPYLDGPVPTTMVYTRYGHDRGTVDLDLDLGKASMALSFFEWSKPPGEPGQARATLELEKEQLAGVRRFEITAGTLMANGRGRFGSGKDAPHQVEFQKLDVGETRLENVSLSISGGPIDATIGGGQIDARPLLADGVASGESRLSIPFALEAPHLARIILGDGRELADVAVSLRRDAVWWDRMVVAATLPGGKLLQLRYEPVPEGMHRLEVDSPDAGAVLRVLGIYDNVVGGKLEIRGAARDDHPDRPLEASADIRDFRVVRAPFLARLLSIATLTGLVDVLTGEGFLFNRFTSDFTKTGGVVNIPLARAHGPSIGLTAQGMIDFDTDTIDVEGTIVPAYLINNLLGNIPVIGDLLIGGTGQGIIAVIYRASGPLDEPQISVNPLSALTPGFLRGLFDIFDPDAPSTRPRAPSAPRQKN